MTTQDLTERILSGLAAGVNRHWRYTKELLDIKPEYLLTIAVADALSEGIGQLSGLDVEIRLEEPIRSVAYRLLSESVGLRNYFSAPKPKITRKGRVDIFVSTGTENYVIELKGFDPSAGEIEKEVLRIQELLSVNNGNNKCVNGHIAFPTLIERKQWIHRHVAALVDTEQFTHSIESKRVDTGEDSLDGIPCYFANIVTIGRKDAL